MNLPNSAETMYGLRSICRCLPANPSLRVFAKGYMAGQLIPSIVAIVTSTFAIRKDINKSVVSVPFWRDDLKPMLMLI